MIANSASFTNVIGTFVYEIPYFQRSYVWKQEQIVKFLDDMLYVSDQYAKYQAVQQTFEYFMGTVISKPIPLNTGYQVLDLIDGQQRITTFTVFFKVMSLVYGNPGIFDKVFKFDFGFPNAVSVLKIKSSRVDQPIIDKILVQSSNEALDKNGNPILAGKKWSKRAMHPLLVAYNMFRDYLEDLMSQSTPVYINPDYIINGVKFVNMKLDGNDDPQIYFDNINSLGVRLTTSAIVKNFLFSHNTTGYSSYQTSWEPLFEGPNNKYWNGDGVNSNLDEYLFCYLQAKTYDVTMKVSPTDKALYQRKDAVANHIKDFMAKYMHNNPQLLLMDIIQYADTFSKIVVDEVGKLTTLSNKTSVDDMLARIGYLVKKLKVKTLIPYLLFVVNKNQANSTDTLEILKYLESYLIRRNLTDASYKNDNKFFREVLIGKDVLTLDDLKKELDASNGRTTDMPTDTIILTNLKNWDFKGDNETPKALLYLYELELCRRNNANHQPLAPDSYTLEHLMPQTLDRAFWPSSNQNEDHIYFIGNMGLLTQTLQSILKNRGWNDKLNGYQGKPGIKICCSGLYTMNSVISQPTWDDTIIENRTTSIIQDMISIWKS